MKFGPASPADAIGGVTVHTLRQGPLVLKKGTTIGPAEVEALTRAGVKEIVVVRLEEGDVSEDVAAASIAQTPNVGAGEPGIPGIPFGGKARGPTGAAARGAREPARTFQGVPRRKSSRGARRSEPVFGSPGSC